jgi:hypothetical protein
VWSAQRIPRPYSRVFRPEQLLFLPSSSSAVLKMLNGPVSGSLLVTKSDSAEIEPGPLDLYPGTLSTKPQWRSTVYNWNMKMFSESLRKFSFLKVEYKSLGHKTEVFQLTNVLK